MSNDILSFVAQQASMSDMLKMLYIWVRTDLDDSMLLQFKSERLNLLTVGMGTAWAIRSSRVLPLVILILNMALNPPYMFLSIFLSCVQIRCIPDMVSVDGKQVPMADPLGSLLSPQKLGHYDMYGPSIKLNLTVLKKLKVRAMLSTGTTTGNSHIQIHHKNVLC